MSLTTAEITYNLANLVGIPHHQGTSVTATTNIPGDTVVDTDGNAIRLGSGKGSIDSNGSGKIDVWVPGVGSNPASWQTYIHVRYRDPQAANGHNTRTFGPFTITGDANLADLIAEQEIPPEYLSTVTGALQGYVTDAESAATSAASSRAGAEAAELSAQALVLSDLGTTDGQTRALVENPASQTAVALSATYASNGRSTVVLGQGGLTTLKAAITALPSTGGTVIVPEGRYPAGDWNFSSDYMSKPNVKIVGSKVPRLSTNADRLTNGSVIEGRLNAFADGFEVYNVGFDMGKYVADTRYGGADTHTGDYPTGGGWDAFAFGQPNQVFPLGQRRGFKAANVIGLCRDSQSYGHAMLMEGITGGAIDNVIGVGGVHALVIKSQHMRVGRIAGWCGSNDNIIIKADSYAPCGNISIAAAESLTFPADVTPWFTPAVANFGLLCNPATASFSGPVSIGAYKSFGSQRGLAFTGSSANVVSDVQIGSVEVDGYTGATASGIDMWDVRALRVQIANLIVNNANAGISWNSPDANTTEHQLHIGSAQLTNMSTRGIAAQSNARIVIDHLAMTSCLAGYYIDDTARIMVGKERLSGVTTKWERSAPALGGGYGNFGGGNSTFEVLLENYGASLKGLLSGGTGTTFLTLPTYLRPVETRRYPIMVGHGTSARLGIVGTSGVVEISTTPGDYFSVDSVGPWSI